MKGLPLKELDMGYMEEEECENFWEKSFSSLATIIEEEKENQICVPYKKVLPKELTGKVYFRES